MLLKIDSLPSGGRCGTEKQGSGHLANPRIDEAIRGKLAEERDSGIEALFFGAAIWGTSEIGGFGKYMD